MRKPVKNALISLLVSLMLCSLFVFSNSSTTAVAGEETPYDIVSQNVTFTSRHDVELAGTLFYPATYCMEKSGKFPGIVVAEGAIATKEMYYWLAEALASEGYVVLTFDYTGQGKSGTEIIPGVPWPAAANVLDIFGAKAKILLDVWMDDTQDAITYLIEGSPVKDLVDKDKIGLTGHSCGGCATVVVMARDDRVKAASALAPFDLIEPIIPRASDYAAEMAATNPRPLQVQVGTLDLICPYLTMAYPIYRNSAAPRQIIAIANAEHLGYTDTRNLPWIFGAEPGCHEAAEHYTIAWFDYYLKEDDAAYDNIVTKLPMIAHMEYDLGTISHSSAAGVPSMAGNGVVEADQPTPQSAIDLIMEGAKPILLVLLGGMQLLDPALSRVYPVLMPAVGVLMGIAGPLLSLVGTLIEPVLPGTLMPYEDFQQIAK